ncbi:MAG: hypothetical protein IPK60_08105 [Sandaracinaceae bacterium]|nr:hypothetical protein [Sandaracinaceae bacterium]
MKQLACLVALLLTTSAFAQVQTRAPLRQELALRDQQVLSVVQIVQDATSTPIAIESPAAARAACAHITVAAPAGASVSSVLAALGQSL